MQFDHYVVTVHGIDHVIQVQQGNQAPAGARPAPKSEPKAPAKQASKAARSPRAKK